MGNRHDDDRHAAAVDAVRGAAAAVGLAVTFTEPHGDAPADVVLVNPAGGRVRLQLQWVSLAAADGLERRIATWNRQLPDPPAVGLVVDDRVTRQARELLTAAGAATERARGRVEPATSRGQEASL